MDANDWVTWRWAAGLVGVLLILGDWLFAGDPAWLAAPMLAVLTVPRARAGAILPVSGLVLAVQNVPALLVLGLVVHDAATLDGPRGPVLAASCAAMLVAGVGHAGWLVRHRSVPAGVGIVVVAWCTTLLVSGWLSPLDQAASLQVGLLFLGVGAFIATVPTGAERGGAVFTVASAAILAFHAVSALLADVAVPQATTALATAIMAVPVVWIAGRGPRQPIVP